MGEAPSWHLLAGGGTSHPGWGGTNERVETLDLVLRHERPLSGLLGRDWYLHRRSLLIEVPVHVLRSPAEPPMFGLYFQACWTFVANPTVQPYLFGGGGLVYTEAEIPGTSSDFKGSYQAGAGLHFNDGGRQYSLEYRYHHLSNGGIEQPNDPLNSSKLLVGIRLGF